MIDDKSTMKGYHKIATPGELASVFKRHRGEITKIAEDLDISQSVVSEWFTGRNKSPRVEEAVRVRAKELLSKEKELANARQ